MIYFVYAWSRRGWSPRWPSIELQDEHAIEVMGLLLPVCYFFVVWWKASLSVMDSVILTSLYIAYLIVLWRVPPQAQTEESLEDLGAVPRAVLKWVAPFLSEFPEKTSAFYWARRTRGAPMALMNMLSSNINQWTVLAAMIPLVYAVGFGGLEPLRFDPEQRVEILLTVLQSLLAFLLLCNMRFRWWEGLLLFLLWFVQFIRPSLHMEVALAYGAWAAYVLVRYSVRREMRAPVLFWTILTRGPARRSGS